MKKIRVFNFPPEVTLGGVNITIYEDRGAVISNFGRILTCTQSLFRAQTKIGVVRIDGSGMYISDLDREQIQLNGKIVNVAIERADV